MLRHFTPDSYREHFTLYILHFTLLSVVCGYNPSKMYFFLNK
jgi:hypothetical protein